MVLGIVAAVMPLTGFPEWWRALFIFLCGAAIAILGFLLRARAPRRRAAEGGRHLSFVETNGARPSIAAPESALYEHTLAEKIQ